MEHEESAHLVINGNQGVMRRKCSSGTRRKCSPGNQRESGGDEEEMLEWNLSYEPTNFSAVLQLSTAG